MPYDGLIRFHRLLEMRPNTVVPSTDLMILMKLHAVAHNCVIGIKGVRE